LYGEAEIRAWLKPYWPDKGPPDQEPPQEIPQG
jgi:hypothetical protein